MMLTLTVSVLCSELEDYKAFKELIFECDQNFQMAKVSLYFTKLQHSSKLF